MWRDEDLYLIMGGAHPIFDASDTGGLSYCKLLLMSVILQKKRLLLRLRRIHGGGQTLAASAAVVVLALVDENRVCSPHDQVQVFVSPHQPATHPG